MYREEQIAATGPVARIIDLVESLWEDEDEIELFLMTPNAGLGGRRPLDLFLKIGDTVEVSSSKIGALSNKVVASE